MNMIATVLALALALLAQDNVRDLVEKLGSDSLDEREEAVRRIKLIGKPALPELEKAAKGPDLEAATRAKYLLRLIPIRDKVTPRLLHLMPGVEQRLSLDDPHSWTEVLLEAMQIEMGRRGEREGNLFKPEDLEGVVPLAFRGIRDKSEKDWACSAVVHLKLRSAAPEVAKLLDDPIPDVRLCALETLKALGSSLAVPACRRLLLDTDPNVQARACQELAELRDPSAAADIAVLLKSKSAYTRGHAARALGRLGAVEYAKRIGDLLEDPDENARWYAVQAVADLGSRPEAPRVRALLRDRDPNVAASAIQALEVLEGKEAVPALLSSLESQIPLVRTAAAETLCRLGAREAVPYLLEQKDARLELLNGVRRPEAWARLRSLKLKEPLEGTEAELRARLEKEAGLKIEWPVKPLPPRRLQEKGDPLLFVEVLRSLVDGWPEIVVESDRLRLIPPDEARTFWSDWWAGEEKKR